MLKEINSGGTHEQNALGGVPMGVNPQGGQITYEEGETSIPTNSGEYVFSNRLKLDKAKVVELGLPKSMIGKSYADASKFLNNKFKDRSDKISDSTKSKLLSNLGLAQEESRLAEASKINRALNSNSTEVPDMMSGQIPQGFNQPMAWGGASSNNSGGGNFMSSIGGILGSFGQSNNTINSNDPGRPQDETTNTWEATKDVVSNFGPFFKVFRGVEQAGKGIGQAIGGNAGGDFATGFLDPMSNKTRSDYSIGEKLAGIDPLAAGMLAMKKNKELRTKANREEAYQQSLLMGDNYAKGGYVQKMATGGPTGIDPRLNGSYLPSENDFMNPFSTFYMGPGTYNNQSNQVQSYGPEDLYDELPEMNITVNRPTINNVPATSNTITPNTLRSGNTQNNSILRNLRYTPMFMNALQLSKLKKPVMDVPIIDSNKAQRRYVDEMNTIKQVDGATNAAINAMTQAGVSGGAMRANILGAMLQRGTALSNAAMQSQLINNQIDNQADAIDAQTRARNIATTQMAREGYRQDLGAYNTARSGLLGQMGTDLGNIGREETYKDLAANAFGYSWDGKYLNSPNGDKLTPDEYIKRFGVNMYNTITGKNRKSTTDNKKLGGYVFNGK